MLSCEFCEIFQKLFFFSPQVTASGSCSREVERTRHFLLHRPSFANDRRNILKSLYNIESSILVDDDNHIAQTLLYENLPFSNKMLVLKAH